jgi:hypothetical protein
VLGNDEMTDTDGIDLEEGPCNANVVMPSIAIPYDLIPSVVLSSKRHTKTFQEASC